MVLRETCQMWERRAVLTPRQCQDIVKAHSGVEVLVQPSTRRVFSDAEYVAHGAKIENDISKADVVLGVKQPKEIPAAGKMLCCFSHTHKGQKSGEALLQECLQKEVRLLDWERVLDPDTGQRLVHFGRFAGIAGLHEAMSGLGIALLRRGVSSSYLSIPPTFRQGSLDAVFARLADCRPPVSQSPLVICFTGSGNVANGAIEAFRKMPTACLLGSIEELRELFHSPSQRDSNTIYGFQAEASHMYQRKLKSNDIIAKDEYRTKPELYESCFAQKLGPYVSVLVHGSYWTPHHPHLLPVEDIRNRLWPNLRVVADVSCDFEPASPIFDGIHHSTSPEVPFYEFEDILVSAIDVLPASLPREASEHFGSAILNSVLQDIFEAIDKPLDTTSTLIRTATITDSGQLTAPYAYIAEMHEAHRRAAAVEHVSSTPPFVTRLRLRGHLFDSGLINALLDLVELESRVSFKLSQASVDRDAGTKQKRVPSNATIELGANDNQILQELVLQCQKLVAAMPAADASLTLDSKNLSFVPPLTQQSRPRVLVLGAGLVVEPLLQELRKYCELTVVAASASDIGRVSALVNASYVSDVAKDERFMSWAHAADVVVTLLPPALHSKVATVCLEARRHLVTASYASDDFHQKFGPAFKELGLTLVAESGLDPGLDHASATRLISMVRERGGQIDAFASVCGGLPAPEAANNSLSYRFSWSPQGVLNALAQPATFRWQNQDIYVDDLLAHARDYRHDSFSTPNLPAMQVLPNRNALRYIDVYGLPENCNIFRGTLRYSGFVTALRGLRGHGADLGALSKFSTKPTALELSAGRAVLEELQRASSSKSSLADRLGQCYKLDEESRDLCLMRHDLAVTWPSGERSRLISSLEVLGEPKGYTAMAQTVGLTAALMTRLAVLDADRRHTGLITPSHPDFHGPLLDLLSTEHSIQFREREDADADAFPSSFL